MARLQKRGMTRRCWSPDHLIQLADGRDSFCGAWGDDLALPLDQRHEWPPDDVAQDMAAAWAQHGDEIKRQRAVSHPGRPIWGELVFENGMSAREAIRHIHQYHEEHR